MGFISPAAPPFEIEEWQNKGHLERIKPLAQDWAVNGFGTPTAVYLLYIFKLIVYLLGAAVVISATSNVGGLGDLGDWWSDPIVFQKLAVWTLLWEFIGLGAGSMPLTFRFAPPIGGVLYWLRPGAIRMPPWPGRVPGTVGSTRTTVDVLLAAGVIASALYLLLADGEPVPGFAGGRLDPPAIAVLLGFLVLLGLRDKVSFLAARPEVYGFLLIVFVFPIENFFVGSQLVLFFIWWGAASSKLNRHFPFVVSVMISNTPWNRSRRLKARLYRDHPEDLIPSWRAAFAAHCGTVMEFTLPLLLILSSGGPIGTVAVVGMLIFHIHITSTFPLAVPLEWNLFMMFGILFLFGEYGDVPFSTLDDPLLIALLVLIGVAMPIMGNLRPDKVSFLPGMRYYAGNWATSQWLFRKGAEDRLDECVAKAAPIVARQLEGLYGSELTEVLLYKGLAFRSMHTHGRALNGLAFRAVDDLRAYDVREGELISGVCNGWNFGDGHFHNEQLLDAVQERCAFAEGELRVVVLESQPVGRPDQRYRILDAKLGLVEEGSALVADMCERQPWLDGADGEFPVQVDGPTVGAGDAGPG
jgi:hypothetical protein